MIPNRIERYEIKAEIGRGGMARVYLAYDPNFKREVAVKVLPPQFLDNLILRARFQREAQAIAAIEHPAIVPVYDFGEQEQQLFLVMRYMRGGSLASRLRRGALPLDQAANIISRLAAGLDLVHARGIVHRDLKPGNILFDDYGNAFLSDFGIAHLAEATTLLTGDAIIGTPAYMSPEQVRGEIELDGRSDIYALGIILYEMLAGKTPYQAITPMAVAMQHIHAPVPRLLAVRFDLPVGVNDIIATAMAKERENRFSTAGELANALQAVSSTMPAQQDAKPANKQQPAQPESPTLPDTEVVDSPEEVLRTQPGLPVELPVQAEPTPASASTTEPPAKVLAGKVEPGARDKEINPKRSRVLAIGGLIGLLGICGLLGLAILGGGMLLSRRGLEPAPTAVSAGLSSDPTAAPQVEEVFTPAAGTTSFQDDFSSSNSGWPSGEDSAGRYGYEGGSYRIYVDQPNTLYWVSPEQSASDTSIAVDAAKVAGSDDNYFGILCRIQDEQNYYYLIISSNGYYTIGKYKDGEFFSLLEDGWLYSQSIHQGNTTNRLRADCQGNRLSLYANGTKLAEAQDGDFAAGDFGLIAASLATHGTNILFDNFVATGP